MNTNSNDYSNSSSELALLVQNQLNVSNSHNFRTIHENET